MSGDQPGRYFYIVHGVGPAVAETPPEELMVVYADIGVPLCFLRLVDPLATLEELEEEEEEES